jgi:hypothetical protein
MTKISKALQTFCLADFRVQKDVYQRLLRSITKHRALRRDPNWQSRLPSARKSASTLVQMRKGCISLEDARLLLR